MPIYQVAERRLFDAVFQVQRSADPVVSTIRLDKSEHSGPIRSVGGENFYDSEPVTSIAESTIKVAAIEEMDFAAYSALLRNSANRAVESLGTLMFKEMGAITSHVGNTVDGAGKTLAEGLKEGPMKREWDFDEDGTPIFPTFYCAPGAEQQFRAALAELEADPALRAHLLERRKQFLESAPKRRLLSPC